MNETKFNGEIPDFTNSETGSVESIEDKEFAKQFDAELEKLETNSESLLELLKDMLLPPELRELLIKHLKNSLEGHLDLKKFKYPEQFPAIHETLLSVIGTTDSVQRRLTWLITSGVLFSAAVVSGEAGEAFLKETGRVGSDSLVTLISTIGAIYSLSKAWRKSKPSSEANEQLAD